MIIFSGKCTATVAASLIFLFFAATLNAYTPNSNAKRSEVPKEFQWRPSDIFKEDAEWESAYKEVEKSIPSMLNYKGKLGESSAMMKECLGKLEKLSMLFLKVWVYAQVKHHGDKVLTPQKSMYDRAKMLSTEFSKAVSFIDPELVGIPERKLKKFMAKDAYLKIWDHHFDMLIRNKAHILSDKEESLLAAAGDMEAKPEDIFESFKTDVKFPFVLDEKKKKVQLGFTNWTKFRESKSRRVRMDAAKGFFGTLDEYARTFNAVLDGAVKTDAFTAQARKYKSSLDGALESNFFTRDVYDNLVNTIYDNLADSMHKYISMRKKVLKLKTVHFYDLYNPLVPSFDKEYSFEEGKKEVLEALRPMGEAYVEAFKQGSDPKNGWVDIYPNKNKDNGAYAQEVWSVHPYILLNHQNSLDDVSTFAHEFGHGLHYWFAEKKQPYIYFSPETMGAEVASTFNEELLLSYLIKKARKKDEKLYLLNRRLENIRLTFFRQVLFSEFERLIHEDVEAKRPLTVDSLKNIYAGLIKKFYGPDFTLGENDNMEWAYIPHFYKTFYVWKYAAGIASSTALAQNVLKGVSGAREKYIEYLEAGSSDYTLNLLKKAGVDLTQKDSVLAIIKLFSETVDEFEKVYFKK